MQWQHIFIKHDSAVLHSIRFIYFLFEYVTVKGDVFTSFSWLELLFLLDLQSNAVFMLGMRSEWIHEGNCVC